MAIEPQGAFDLREAIAFLDGFGPAGAPQPDAAVLRLAVRQDDGVAVGVAVRQAVPDGPVEVIGGAGAEDHARRILSLDVDGRPLEQIAARDAVVAGLVARHPGRRPALFPSPLQAAAWAVLSQRQPAAQAGRLRDALTAALGDDVQCDGEVRRAFPAPERLAALADDAIEGLWPVKAERLRALGRAAAAGDLDATMLRELPAAEALARVQELPGIGPFGAMLIVIRGVGHPDVVPPTERRLRVIVADAYGLAAEPDDEQLEALAEAWRPLRSWVAFLLRSTAR